jgi:hypothetical protein
MAKIGSHSIETHCGARGAAVPLWQMVDCPACLVIIMPMVRQIRSEIAKATEAELNGRFYVGGLG